MSQIQFNYAPQLVPSGDWIETIAADAMKWLLVEENFNDVMQHGKRLFSEVCTSEAKCKEDGTAPGI